MENSLIKKTPEELRNEFWENDLHRGGIVRLQYEEIKRVLATNDKKWVEEQYKRIKQHAIDETEYYKNYSVTDNFPVVNKAMILKDYESHKARSGYDGPLHISSTSGSTGIPFSVIQDYKKRMRTIADLKVLGELCDYPSHERMVCFRVLKDKKARTSEQENRENIYYIDAGDLSKKHLEEMLKELLEKKPRIVFAYASTLIELAKYILTVNVNKDVFSMKSVLTSGEGISEKDRIMLEKVFNCKVYCRYADMELGILGQDMGDGGAYKLNYGSFFFECLKEDSDEPALQGEVGRIVITDLFNYAFPMIRYDTGDLGIMETKNKDEFPVFRAIYGRKRDCIYSTAGGLISPAKISVSMWEIQGVNQWQFIQETEKEYVMKINGDASVDSCQIIEKMKDIVGNDAIIQLEYVDEIPVMSSKKRRAVICNYKKEFGNQ